MEKVWLKNYEKGVPETINPDEYSSLADFAQECFTKYAEKACYTNMGTELTYRQIDELSQAFAHFLKNTCRLEKGDRVAIVLPNILQYPVALFGIHKAGLVAVNVNPLYTPRELKHILKDSGAKCVIILANFAHVLEQVLPETIVQHIVVTELGDLLGGFKGHLVNFAVKYIKKMVPAWHIPDAHPFKKTIAYKPTDFKAAELKGDDIAFLQYTGGTTGVIKGAILTHRNMVANVLQAYAWVAPVFDAQMEGGVITALPLYHIFSLTANCLVFLRIGIPNILITNPRDIPGFVKELKRQPFAVMTGVNTLFNALLHNDDFCNLDFSKFRFTLGGGMAVQSAVAKKWHEVTGIPLIEAYGLTETSPAVTINPTQLTEYNGSIGLPVPSTEIKICAEDGKELSFDEAGELCVRGPQVMRGYWNQPRMTAEVLSEDGWLRTGDVATVDHQGFVRIVDRKKDIIIVSGFNVYPNEVEDVIAGLKGVREVAVIGVKSEAHGEIVKAYIVRKDPSLTADEIIAYCHKELTGYKVPKEIEFRTELPKSNVGKVLRRKLREEDEHH
ncbi:MAG: long-chain-fatty-acid--CoA ligase [Gammaproteobacteria bacterium 39-13]|nr:AMP-binding protein [Gammaproteobacteria bacterium]OJV87823.1 MAG: long-chain-fatty-acid--CoA ligase [Gammaproteobacteria bacterium 39-13]